MTDPLTPANCDLRDFPYMPLYVVRLRNSEAAAILSAEEFRAAMFLWCAAWHQVPAASVPVDDRVLANLAGFGRDVAGWQSVKDGALRGFILCSDGRLYHPVIAEKAIEAQAKRRSQQKRTAAATAAAAKKRADRDDDIPVARDGHRNGRTDGLPEDVRNGFQAKGREEKRTEEKTDDEDERRPAAAPSAAAQRFIALAMLPRLTNELLAAMPQRKGGHPKKAATSAFRAVLLDGQDADAIIACARGYADEARRNGTIGTDAIKPADAWLVARPWIKRTPEWKRTGGYALAKQVAEIAGRAGEFEITGWGGAAERAQQWLEGWPEETILASVREQAAKKRGEPAHSIKYFENGIAEFIARQSAPLPNVVDLPAKTIEVNRERQSTGSIIAASDRLIEQVREPGRPPGIRGQESPHPVRLLPQGGRE